MTAESAGLAAMAPAGQAAMQAPQPVHRSAARLGWAGPPKHGRKRIAASGHASPQLSQTIPRPAKQAFPMTATCGYGAMARSKTGSGQASAHFPQKVHSPALKSTNGLWHSSSAMIDCGQASTQPPQPEQAEAMIGSRLQGGRTAGLAAKRPLRNFRLSSQGPTMTSPNVPAGRAAHRVTETSRRGSRSRLRFPRR